MVLTSIILACTNLPKEIESRVIYTIVTKPTTRLELIVGKVMGFARVSATVLIIMGLFTWGYLEIRQRGQLKQVAERLRSGTVSPTGAVAAVALHPGGPAQRPEQLAAGGIADFR